MNEIDKNCECIEGAFLGELRKNNVFDTFLFDKLIFEILNLIKSSSSITNELDKIRFILECQKKIFFIYARVSILIVAHFDKENLFKIKRESLNSTIYYDYIDRLEFVINCFMANDYNRILDYEDDLGKLV